MNAKDAAAAWAVLSTAPDLFPHLEWRIFCNEYTITIVAYSEHRNTKVVYGIAYIELANHFEPARLVRDVLMHMMAAQA